jgi:hypothetical protein
MIRDCAFLLRWSRRARVWISLFATTVVTSAQTAEERFTLANAAYASGDFAESAYQLRELAVNGPWSHGALHNLGNSEWKVSRPGYAVLAWERARALNPFDRNTVANLHFARKQAELTVPKREWFEQYSEWLPPATWLTAASVGLWGGIILLALPRLFVTKRVDWHQALAAVLLAAFLLSLPALAGLHTRRKIGVILEEETPLRLSPTRDGEARDSLGKLAAGEVARVENTRGEYLYVRADGDRAGWVHQREFRKIWP